MLKNASEKDRGYLSFTQEVLTDFNFLIKEYGFRCVKTELTFVRYESEHVFVNVYHGRSSYELGVEIGRLSKYPEQEESFAIGEIMELLGVRENEGFTFYQASTAERVKKFLPKLAQYVEKFAGEALQGNEVFFKQLRELQSQISDNYLKSIKVSRIKQKAEIAWHAKNYSEVIKLYGEIKAELTPSENKRLEYAERKASR